MKKINCISAVLCLLMCASAHAVPVYKSLDEHPAEKGSALETYLVFVQACKERDVEEIKRHSTSRYRLMLENSPTALDHLHKRFGEIDFERPFLYREILQEKGNVRLKILCHKKGIENRRSVGVYIIREGEAWKVKG